MRPGEPDCFFDNFLELLDVLRADLRLNLIVYVEHPAVVGVGYETCELEIAIGNDPRPLHEDGTGALEQCVEGGVCRSNGNNPAVDTKDRTNALRLGVEQRDDLVHAVNAPEQTEAGLLTGRLSLPKNLT